MAEGFHGVVAIDGPSGSGKSTVARRLATTLAAGYLDTGAMYRSAAVAALRAGADLADPDAIDAAVAAAERTITTDPAGITVRVDGETVDAEIRGAQVTGAVSAVAAVPAVRRRLIAEQRAIIAAARGGGGIVVEGRDIAAVVAPDAELKVYLTADETERARRRSAETATDRAATAADLSRRDRADSKVTTPLAAADGALTLDTTGLGIDEVVARLVELLAEADRAGTGAPR